MRAPLALLGLTLLASPAVAQNVAVEEFSLDNGMTWLLVPRDEEPHTVSVGWVAKVGSVNERPGITGISHFFEHMMFKGTTTVGTRDADADAALMARQHELKNEMNAIVWGEQYGRYLAGEIDDPWSAEHDTPRLAELRAELRLVQEQHGEIIVKNEFDSIYTNAGASGLNAFTSHDLTFYIIGLPANKLELWAWMESDRLADSVFREFYTERDVVHEERRMRLESSPTGRLDEQFDAMFWMSSPYSWSVIGWPYDLNSYTRDDFDAYFDIYYRPNNLVGVVVGDFDPAEVKELAARYFGRIPRGAIAPPPVRTLEMPQLSEKRMAGECDCQDQLEVRYHTVPWNHADSFALDIMAEVLNGRTGRLYKAMVEGAEIASSAGVGADARKYAGAFSFRAETKGEATTEQLEQAWYDQLALLQSEPVGEQELQKVKNQVAADAYRSLQSNDFIRLQVGYYEALGGWEYVNEAPKRLAAVTADDILRVANTYFAEENRSVAHYARRAGAEPDPLDAFDGQARQMIDGILGQVANAPTDALPGIIGQLEQQKGMLPEELEPAMDYILGVLEQRLADDGGHAEEEQG